MPSAIHTFEVPVTPLDVLGDVIVHVTVIFPDTEVGAARVNFVVQIGGGPCVTARFHVQGYFRSGGPRATVDRLFLPPSPHLESSFAASAVFAQIVGFMCAPHRTQESRVSVCPTYSIRRSPHHFVLRYLECTAVCLYRGLNVRS